LLYHIIRRATDRAKILKEFSPYRFRVRCAIERSNLSEGYFESMMGWVQGSSMGGVYTSSAGVAPVFMWEAKKMAGLNEEDPSKRDRRVCWRCREPLPVSAKFCPRCATPQDNGDMIDTDEMAMRRKAVEIINDSALLATLAKQL